MYLQRNARGEIIALSKMPGAEFTEQLPDEDAQIQAFLFGEQSAEQHELAQTDQAMARVMEDVVSLLVEQGVIRFTDLPVPAQQKLLTRRELRDRHKGIALLDDGDHLPL